MKSLLLVVSLVALVACGQPDAANIRSQKIDHVKDGGTPVDDADPCGDEDGDHVVNFCDQCPQDRETYQGSADYDGCPDYSHQFLSHPENRFRSDHFVLQHGPGGEKVIDQELTRVRDWITALASEGVDFKVACVSQASAGEPDPVALSKRRAATICGGLEGAGAELVALGRGTAPLYPGEKPPDSAAISIVQVIEWDGYWLYKVVDGALSREGRPTSFLIYPPPSPGCDLQGRPLQPICVR